jgi:hypothetical protein
VTTPETTDLAGTAIERLTPYLPGAATGAPWERERAAAEPLYDAIANRLRALDEGTALDEFVQQPQNNSLVRRLLTTAVGEDPAFAEELATAVRATPAAPAPAAAVRTAQASTPIGVRSADAAGPDDPIDNAGGRTRTRRPAGLLIGLVALAVVAALVCVAGRVILSDLRSGNGLTAESSCEEFLRAPKEEQSGAIEEIGLAKGVADLDSPMARPAIAEICTAQPAARLGDVVEKFRG